MNHLFHGHIGAFLPLMEAVTRGYPVLILAEDGRTLYQNQAARQLAVTLLNLPALQTAINHVFTLNKQDLQQVQIHQERIAVGEKIFLLSIVPFIQAEELLWILLLHNITEEMEKDRKLQEANEVARDLEAIFNFSYDGIFLSDGNARALRYNESFCHLTGIPPKLLLGMTMQEILDKGYTSESVTLKVLEQKKPVTTMPKMPSARQLMMTGTPVFNEEDEIVRVITNVRDLTDLNSLKSELDEAREQSARYYFEILQLRSQLPIEIPDYIVENINMKRVVYTAVKAATSEVTMLIMGDSGTGKEGIAHLIHEHSEYKNGPFFKINCSAIPDSLLESELFGYEKGAFTNAAHTGKVGLFEMAAGGTLFLDEIGELPLLLQAKLLGVLQDKKFTRVGGIEEKQLKARVIAATNKNLTQMVEQQLFRKDLYYRLNVVAITLPPLQERKEDILPLASLFLARCNTKYGTNKTFSPQVLTVFLEYEWPGNVRQFEHVIERMVLLTQTDYITVEHLPEEMQQTPHTSPFIQENLPLEEMLGNVERQIFARLIQQKLNTYQIADILKISQATVSRKLRRLRLHTQA